MTSDEEERKEFIMSDQQVSIKVEGGVAPNCSVNLAVRSELGYAFQSTGIVIPDSVAAHVLVTDLKVGKNSQLCSTGALPGFIFCEGWRSRLAETRLALDVVNPGEDVTFSISNTSHKPLEFSAEVVGYPLPAPPPAEPELELWYALGFGYYHVPPGKRVRLSSQPQVDFTPEKIFMYFNVFDLEEVELGRQYLGVVKGQDGYSATLSSSLVCTPSQFVTLHLRNRSSRAEWFSGAVLGRRVAKPSAT